MENNIIFRSEQAVKKFMLENGAIKIRMYITAFVNSANQQDWGFSVKNVNSDYYLKQKSIRRKTKTFTVME